MLDFSKNIYIAGPMSGYPEYNFPAFDHAAKLLRKLGHRVTNPAELDRLAGIHEHTAQLPVNAKREAMKRDCAAICDCNLIALLPGWEKSAGVKVELTLAGYLGIPAILVSDIL
jgi:hypothetical protein